MSAPTSTKPILFWNKVCPFVHRAWLAAIEKNADLEFCYIALGANKPEWYEKEVNPSGTVPCLKLPNGTVIRESMFVAQYIDENYGVKGSLQSGSAVQKYAVRMFMAGAAKGVVSTGYGLLMTSDASKLEECKKKALAAADALEAAYAKQSESGPYFLGETFGIADVAVLPFLDRFRHTLLAYRGFKLLEGHPRLVKLMQAAESRPSFALTAQPADFYITCYKGYANGPLEVDFKGKLYYNDGCPFAARARLANVMKGSPFEEVEVALPTPDWFKKINPLEELPAIQLHDGTTLSDSIPLVQFIDEYSGSVDAIASVAGNVLQPTDPKALYDTRFLLSQFEDSSEGLWGAIGGSEEASKQTLSNLSHLNGYYAEQEGNKGGAYFLGKTPTFADCVLLPFWVRVEALYEVKLVKFAEDSNKTKTFAEMYPALAATVTQARSEERFANILKSKASYVDYFSKE